MRIKVVEDKVNITELKDIAQEFYKFMIKGVVDIEEELAAFGGEYHMDANMILIDRGSKQQNIWGFNVHVQKQKDEDGWIEYTSLINIRPNQGNLSMEVSDPQIRERIRTILEKIIE